MLPHPKEDNLNPKLIGTLLLIISLVFLVLGGMNFLTITSAYYFKSENALSTVKSVERNKWPRFRTFTYELEYRDAANALVSASAIASEGILPGSQVDIIYTHSNPQEVYFKGAYLPAISYHLGTIGLGLFIGLFGLNQVFTQRSSHQTSKQTPSMSLPIGKTKMPPAIKLVQNILIILLMVCLIGYLIGGSN